MSRNSRKMSLILLVFLIYTSLIACSTGNTDEINITSIVPESEVNKATNESVKEEPLEETKESKTSDQNITEIVTTLYTININDYKNDPVSGIPSYSLGKIEFITEEAVKSFYEGHHSWMGHAETFVSIKASNLVPDEYKKDDTILEDFIKVKLNSYNEAEAIIKFDDNFYYEVKMESSDITGGIFFITNINLHVKIYKK
ncbi:hypothetical protein [Paenibacillus marinisediminis]